MIRSRDIEEATVVALASRRALTPEPLRDERELGAAALWELSLAEQVLDEAGVPGEVGQPLDDRLRAHFASQ